MAGIEERRSEQMRELLRSARRRNDKVVAEALSGNVASPTGRRRRKSRPAAPPAPSPFSTDEAGAVLRQALNRAAAVELRWHLMLQDR